MPLSNIIGRAIDLNTIMGVTVQAKAVAAAVELLRADAEATDEARYVAASRLIHDQATKAMRKVMASSAQGSLFFGQRLRARYALDTDGRIIKDTDRLTRLEWRRAIQIRMDQLEADKAHLDAMRLADRELSPIWDEYPQKMYGEVERIYLARRNGNGARAA